MFTIRAVTVAAMLTGCVAAANGQPTPAACADGQCIQVGSYNIELLGSNRERYAGIDRGPRTAAQLAELADRISDTLDLEVVVFQEINKESSEWAALKLDLAAKGYQFFEGSSSDRKQFVVLAWDADEVSLVDGAPRELNVRNAFEFGDGCREDGLRKPVAGRFRAGQFDFWVVGVHLKSRRGDSSCTTRIRAAQCEDLVEAVDGLIDEFGEGDVLVTGDFNETYEHVSFKPLVDAGFISQMRFLTNESATGSYVKTGSLHESDDLIDQVWIRYNQTTEVVKNSASVMRFASADETKKYIIEQSDHAPAWVSFRIDTDLDEDDED